MNAEIRFFRLSPPGGGGLACDKSGVALGPALLVRLGAGGSCEILAPGTLASLLSAAYGTQPESVTLRVHRGLARAARALKAGDLCLAGIETVLLGLPDPTPDALTKLAHLVALEKWGAYWQYQPRVPAGNPDGGEWTTGDGPSGASPRPAHDDAVYRPSTDSVALTPTGGAPEDAEASRRSNGPPADFTSLEDVFPGLGDTPNLTATLEPFDDAFFGIGAAADEANLEATMGQYGSLLAEIKEIDPSYFNDQLLPPGGIEGLTREGRNNLIDGLLMQRAAAYYRMRGDVGRLQVETLRFLQKAVDTAYIQAVTAADTGRLQPRLSRQEAIGDDIDARVRTNLKRMLDSFNIPYGPRQTISVNNRDYADSEGNRSFTIPDARLGDVSYDWTLFPKSLVTPQVQGFFAADSNPRAVVIVRPSQLGQKSTYLIPRPSNDPR